MSVRAQTNNYFNERVNTQQILMPYHNVQLTQFSVTYADINHKSCNHARVDVLKTS